MTFIEAAKKSRYVRRPIAKHLGSGGDGWIDAQFAFEQGRSSGVGNTSTSVLGIQLLTWTDFLADDWEYKKEYNRMNPDRSAFISKMIDYSKIDYGTEAYPLSTAEAKLIVDIVRSKVIFDTDDDLI